MDENIDIPEIITGCKRGRNESFSRLLDIYSSRCYGYFYRLTSSRDVSDELLSELFVKLVEKIKTYRGGSFNGWLFKVMRNVFYDYLRRKFRDGRILERQKEQMAEDFKRERDDDERIDQLQQRLLQLDEVTREVIVLRFYSQLSFKEIARMRGEPIGTVLTRVHRGLKKLRGLME